MLKTLVITPQPGATPGHIATAGPAPAPRPTFVDKPGGDFNSKTPIAGVALTAPLGESVPIDTVERQ